MKTRFAEIAGNEATFNQYADNQERKRADKQQTTPTPKAKKTNIQVTKNPTNLASSVQAQATTHDFNLQLNSDLQSSTFSNFNYISTYIQWYTYTHASTPYT